jgi:hypothetical protein
MTVREMDEFLKKVQSKQERAVKIMRDRGLMFSSDDDKWESLAFTFYTMLCELDLNARHLLEEIEDKPEAGNE